MNCKTPKKLIPAFVDGELGSEKAADLERHIASCHSCRQEMATLKRTMDMMGMIEDIEPSFTLSDIRERASQRRHGNPVSSLLWQMPRLATAATVILALAAGSFSGIYYGSHINNRAHEHSIISNQRVSNSFGLDAFDNGLAGAMYTAEVTR